MSLSQVEKEIEKLQKELLDCNQERKKEIGIETGGEREGERKTGAGKRKG